MSTAIPLQTIKSSQLDSIGHDPATNTLAVQFKPGKAAAAKGEPGPVYHYANVTAEDFAAMSGAESIGSHFYREIKPKTEKHPFTRVPEVA